MKKIIILNHKMNLQYPEIKNYLKKLEKIKTNHELIIAPSNIYLIEFLKNSKYSLASQDAYYEQEGPFTGEISSQQLKSLGVKYQLVGHSERRDYFHETNEIINKKMMSCFKNNITPILCIGESLQEYQEHNVELTLNREIQESLLGVEEIKDLIIAYEPKWSIGSNKVLNYNELNSIIEYIDQLLTEGYKINPIILYGGSIDENNIEEILKIPKIDGVLIGDSSKDIEKIKEIFKRID